VGTYTAADLIETSPSDSPWISLVGMYVNITNTLGDQAVQKTDSSGAAETCAPLTWQNCASSVTCPVDPRDMISTPKDVPFFCGYDTCDLTTSFEETQNGVSVCQTYRTCDTENFVCGAGQIRTTVNTTGDGNGNFNTAVFCGRSCSASICCEDRTCLNSNVNGNRSATKYPCASTDHSISTTCDELSDRCAQTECCVGKICNNTNVDGAYENSGLGWVCNSSSYFNKLDRAQPCGDQCSVAECCDLRTCLNSDTNGDRLSDSSSRYSCPASAYNLTDPCSDIGKCLFTDCCLARTCLNTNSTDSSIDRSGTGWVCDDRFYLNKLIRSDPCGDSCSTDECCDIRSCNNSNANGTRSSSHYGCNTTIEHETYFASCANNEFKCLEETCCQSRTCNNTAINNAYIPSTSTGSYDCGNFHFRTNGSDTFTCGSECTQSICCTPRICNNSDLTGSAPVDFSQSVASRCTTDAPLISPSTEQGTNGLCPTNGCTRNECCDTSSFSVLTSVEVVFPKDTSLGQTNNGGVILPYDNQKTAMSGYLQTAAQESLICRALGFAGGSSVGCNATRSTLSFKN